MNISDNKYDIQEENEKKKFDNIQILSSFIDHSQKDFLMNINIIELINKNFNKFFLELQNNNFVGQQLQQDSINLKSSAKRNYEIKKLNKERFTLGKYSKLTIIPKNGKLRNCKKSVILV